MIHHEARSKYSPLIFVVDDDPIAVCMIEGILNRNGFRTSTAGDVEGALDGIRKELPDLVVLDVNLPDGSGFDVCITIHADASTSSIPILFISADNDTETKVLGFEAGGVDYVTKPISAPELNARVRTHLQLKAAYGRLSELQAERIQRLASAQQTLMPRPEGFREANFQVYVRQMCSAGGDFYDVISAGEDVVDYLVADASGHDLAASYWTAALKALAAEYANAVHEPLDVVRAINASLCRFLPSGAFFTLIYVRLNHRTGRLTVVDAGHPPALVVRAGGKESIVVRQEGDVVGAFSDALFGVHQLTMEPQDRIFLYSDSLVEARVQSEEGTRRLVSACTSHHALSLEEIVPAVVAEMTTGIEANDDTILLCIERKGQPWA
jgi:sigma-B regulation protein RsbU (phosphoserine phosphatase)